MLLSQNLAESAEGAAALQKEAPKHQNARKVRSPPEKRLERRFGTRSLAWQGQAVEISI